MAKKIDVTPTWSGILRALLAVMQDGNAEGRKEAIKELQNMATAADQAVKMSKTLINPDFQNLSEPFDGFEIHPCKQFEDPKGVQFVEQVEPEEAEFWSVYVHNVSGGLACIADFATEAQAEAFQILCESLLIFNKTKK